MVFNPAAKRAWDDLPVTAQQDFGHALRDAQDGLEPTIAKTLSGFGDAGVVELRLRDEAGAYRAVYTVRYEEAIYVLHAFQKKSHKGIATDQADLSLVRARLKWAEVEHQRRRGGP